MADNTAYTNAMRCSPNEHFFFSNSSSFLGLIQSPLTAAFNGFLSVVMRDGVYLLRNFLALIGSVHARNF